MKKQLGYRGDADNPGQDLKVVPRSGLRIWVSRQDLQTSRRRPSQNADRLFAALDGSEVQTSGCRYDLEVYSVTDQATGRWVQLGLRGTQEHLVTLRLPIESGLSEATTALSRWLSDPAHAAESLHVA